MKTLIKTLKEKIDEQIELKNVIGRKHSFLPLTIYSYTNRCQHKSAWNETTLQCRGLVLDDDGEVVSKLFGKFFNNSESQVYQHLIEN